MSWDVLLEPVGDNPGMLKRLMGSRSSTQPENTGGMVIFLTNNGARQEFSRVAFIRRAEVCRNPTVTFQTQLDFEIAKAREAVRRLNEVFEPTQAGPVMA